MSRKALTERDVREAPAYSIAEAAGYLRLPKSTLRAWLLGQQSFHAVIDIADRQDRHMSFINLVEAFVLSGIRRQYSVSLPKVRKAIHYLRRTFNTQRPLADEQFATDGVHLFVEKYGTLIGATQQGQVQMREVILDRLKYVLRDLKGVPEKIVLFPGPGAAKQGDVIIDPRLSFGRPVIDGIGVRTATVAQRFRAGDSIDELVREYSVTAEAVQNAIRCELLAA